ncbi:MAG: hypothetical protein JW910_07695 [Anaerolineae bacterium]|nr:hypothetical protein [Anaerolineae bacterium]
MAQQQQVEEQAISWQYVVLAIFIAFLIPLVAAVPVDIERPSAPVVVAPVAAPRSFAELELNAHFEEEGGVSLDYPADWQAELIPPNNILVANYSAASERSPLEPGESRLIMNRLTLLDLISAGVQIDPEMSALEMIEALLTEEALAQVTLEATTIGGMDAAQGHITDVGFDEMLFLIKAGDSDSTLILGIYDVLTDEWEAGQAFYVAMLDTLQFTPPAAE